MRLANLLIFNRGAILLKLSKYFKFIAVSLSLAISINPIFAFASSSSANVTDQAATNVQVISSDPYEEGLLEYQKSQINQNESDPQARAGIVSLVKVVFKLLAKNADDVVVTATKKNVTTTLKNHAIKQAVARGITEIMLDNILSETAVSMLRVLKFEDVLGQSRIMYDPGSKLTVVLSLVDNIIITTYVDNDNTMPNRVNAGRWKPSTFTFR
ncbi:hypothetical protein R50912_06035 [Paenibacillus sp. FSL R5-0912]|nr:hypothetical protein R50912_06035 [Paenibacillus sp. FSL R5-0912]